MAKSSTLIQQFALLGARTRLAELKAESADIERAFPGIAGATSGKRRPGRPRAADQPVANAPRRKRKPMTAAQKKAVGERMRKYWAERRKADAGKKR